MIHSIRKLLRNINSEVVCGKTTVIQKAFVSYIEKNKKNLPKYHTEEGLKNLSDTIHHLQTMIIFTNEELHKITEITKKFVVEKSAKVGSLSPVQVIIPAGPTGLDASQIEYFGAMRIATKVIKNQLEIVSPAKILIVGQKITMSEVNIMKKFNIKPYKYHIDIQHIYMNSKVYDNEILKITPEHMKERLQQAIHNIAAFGIEVHIPNSASARFMIEKAFRNIVGLAKTTDLEISYAKGIGISKMSEKLEVQENMDKQETTVDIENCDGIDFGNLFG